MYELLIYPLVISSKNSIIHTKNYEKIIKNINKINFAEYGVKLLKIERYKNEDLIYVKIEFDDNDYNYDPLNEPQLNFILTLNNNYKHNIKFVGFKEKYKNKWEKYIYD